ncbi:DUF2017 domain-containing protein [Corynebacterium ulceribovis]|uniref:DUF2017 domain-containing protein n=1 Tax=Corynebacterium ulceribovis TaxID=487732 RepID=UPI00037D694C|nr:DUF2017 domain-containing protein [Corynebacterium ulceribovis]
MEAWKRRRGLFGGQVKISTQFEPIEREVLGNLAATVADRLMERAQSGPRDELEELTGMRTGNSERPSDPALARLLPDFEKPEDEITDGDNALMRSLHEADITTAKLQNLREVVEMLGPDGTVNVVLNEGEANAWLVALNDIRLYIHTLLEAQEPGARPQLQEATQQTYLWLNFCQESLLEALIGE